MSNILKYDLFIFDFDGTIFDTEYIHYECWKEVLIKYTKNESFTINTYFKYYHSLEKNNFRKYLYNKYQINDELYDKLYERKCNIYMERANYEEVNLLKNIDKFINFLNENNKKLIIVTNASSKFISIYKNKYSIMKKFNEIYTKEDFKNKKPNPECYNKIEMKYKNLKKICFEDSLTGIESLSHSINIDKVFINNEKYYYYEYILNNYKNLINIKDYNINELNNLLSIN
tara:strand:+ start:2081 stop:2770 length:690 start_codon:yes stop_codon:yes gene_type:complete